MEEVFIKKAFITFLVTFLIMMFAVSNVSAAYYTHWVDRIEEEYPAWCWVASCEMLVKSKITSSRGQSDTVAYIAETYYNPDEENWGANYQYMGGNFIDLYYAVKYLSNNSISPVRGTVPLTKSGLISKLSAGYPVIADLLVTDAYPHDFVIYYYNDVTNQVKIVDPDTGVTARPYIDYDDLVDGIAEYNGAEIHWIQYVSIGSIS